MKKILLAAFAAITIGTVGTAFAQNQPVVPFTPAQINSRISPSVLPVFKGNQIIITRPYEMVNQSWIGYQAGWEQLLAQKQLQIAAKKVVSEEKIVYTVKLKPGDILTYHTEHFPQEQSSKAMYRLDQIAKFTAAHGGYVVITLAVNGFYGDMITGVFYAGSAALAEQVRGFAQSLQ